MNPPEPPHAGRKRVQTCRIRKAGALSGTSASAVVPLVLVGVARRSWRHADRASIGWSRTSSSPPKTLCRAELRPCGPGTSTLSSCIGRSRRPLPVGSVRTTSKSSIRLEGCWVSTNISGAVASGDIDSPRLRAHVADRFRSACTDRNRSRARHWAANFDLVAKFGLFDSHTRHGSRSSTNDSAGDWQIVWEHATAIPNDLDSFFESTGRRGDPQARPKCGTSMHGADSQTPLM